MPVIADATSGAAPFGQRHEPRERNMGHDHHEPSHSVKKEPKFCRCRVCHEHFYANTIAEAAEACREHSRAQHPDWGVTACFCPD